MHLVVTKQRWYSNFINICANVPVWLDYLGLWVILVHEYQPSIFLIENVQLPALSSGLCSLKSGTDKITLCLDICGSSLVKETNFNVAIVNLSKNFAYSHGHNARVP